MEKFENYENAHVEMPKRVNIDSADNMIARLNDSIETGNSLTRDDLNELSEMIKTLQDLQDDFNDVRVPVELGVAIAKLINIRDKGVERK